MIVETGTHTSEPLHLASCQLQIVGVPFLSEVQGQHVYQVSSLGMLVHNVSPGLTTTFGHGARHLTGTGLSQHSVESAIAQQIQAQAAQGAQFGGGFWGRVVVNGSTIEYRAFTLPGRIINVGTYYIP